MKLLRSLLLLSASILLLTSTTHAAPSAPKEDTSDPVKLYNKAWEALQELEFAEAAKLLRSSLEENDDFAEAHNNLAYSLRKQGKDHFDEALRHYTRAIEIDRRLVEAYMYRGVLYIQMGNKDKALADHATLLKMDEKLAAELEWVIENGKEKEPEQFFGVAKKIDI